MFNDDIFKKTNKRLPHRYIPPKPLLGMAPSMDADQLAAKET